MKKSKKCSSCDERKPIADFGKQHNTADGFRPYCRKCAGMFRIKKREERAAGATMAKRVEAANAALSRTGVPDLRGAFDALVDQMRACKVEEVTINTKENRFIMKVTHEGALHAAC